MITKKRIINTLLALDRLGMKLFEPPVLSKEKETSVRQEKTGRPQKDALIEIAQRIKGCRLCKLHRTRRRVVPGEGSPSARLVFVGEGPGEEEDRQGRPFVGKAGQLLDKIIENGMGLKREEVYIANVIKCRPPGNRDPRPDEIAACKPYLFEQLKIINPEVIVALGRYAAATLLDIDPITVRINRLRGRFHRLSTGTLLMVTYHPSALLRNPALKRPVWEDIKKVMEVLGISIKR